MALYKGFSSFEYVKEKRFSITDVELVKLDLVSLIFTRKSSRLMMPTFGTSIPDILFEPLDEITLEAIRSDLRDVFDFDPRVALESLQIIPDYDNNTISAIARLNYVELNITDNLELNLIFQGEVG